jgi:hypothetical protein
MTNADTPAPPPQRAHNEDIERANTHLPSWFRAEKPEPVVEPAAVPLPDFGEGGAGAATSEQPLLGYQTYENARNTCCGSFQMIFLSGLLSIIFVVLSIFSFSLRECSDALSFGRIMTLIAEMTVAFWLLKEASTTSGWVILGKGYTYCNLRTWAMWIFATWEFAMFCLDILGTRHFNLMDAHCEGGLMQPMCDVFLSGTWLLCARAYGKHIKKEQLATRKAWGLGWFGGS